MNTHAPIPPESHRLGIDVFGVVQGVGFRPFVWNLAGRLELGGWVRNQIDRVRIEIQGSPEALEAFRQALVSETPPLARIERITVESLPAASMAPATFEILASPSQGAPRPSVPPDLATCEACLDEIRSADQRRFRYAFTNCTHCGPRWSIVRSLPYDRARTSMAGFPMCDFCQREYDDPSDRRFHAQPIACPQCGPTLRLLDPGGNTLAKADDAMQFAANAVTEGKIVAIKGLGGFQLVCDATNGRAVRLLRQRKRRPTRPLAVLLRSVEDARRRCDLGDEEAEALLLSAAPILLLRCRPGGDIVEEVAPGNPYLGVMLPCTPLHHLLVDAVARPIVCTSGNLTEEPMAIEIDDALTRLGPLADLILAHNRPIERAVDDSVARHDGRRIQILRRARGYAPGVIELPGPEASLVAVGGHLKNTVAARVGSLAVIGPHVGDLDNLLSIRLHERTLRDLVEFFALSPRAVACDLHPDYASTRLAETLADQWRVPIIRVQHHHAHVASCMAEHGVRGPVLGLAFDGTGMGTDRTVWGGEMLLCEDARFDRVAHLRPFSLPGGDRAIREPRRSALGVLFEIFGPEAADMLREHFTQPERATLVHAIERSIHSPRTSSMGRLFDAIACLVGLPPTITFEGEAAMALEHAVDPTEPYRSADRHAYAIPLSNTTPAVADWEPMIRRVLADVAAGVPRGRIASAVHSALAELAVTVSGGHPDLPVVLTGGCFQNAVLTDRARVALESHGRTVLTHAAFPPGDGGIALGQLAVALLASSVRE